MAALIITRFSSNTDRNEELVSELKRTLDDLLMLQRSFRKESTYRCLGEGPGVDVGNFILQFTNGVDRLVQRLSDSQDHEIDNISLVAENFCDLAKWFIRN